MLHAADAMSQTARKNHEFEFAALVFGKDVVEQVVSSGETGTGMTAVQIKKHKFVDRVDHEGQLIIEARPSQAFSK
jgi:hypothetical protein